jgi:hypothetical protein
VLLLHHAPQGVIVAPESSQAKSCKGHRCMNQSVSINNIDFWADS